MGWKQAPSAARSANILDEKAQTLHRAFVGSACLFFAIKPPKAILGDLNPELIATYIEVKYRIGAVLKELKRLKPEDKEEYLRLRAIDISKMSPPARAARFIYLNR
jgi:DNA adenine methylase